VSLPDEPLAASAALAWRIAERSCREECLWYHRPWQVFRQIGLIHSIRTNSPFLVEVLRKAARAQPNARILICGSADYGMLAHVLHAFTLEGAQPDVSLLDLCATPLALNQWYAARAKREIRVIQSNVLEFEPKEPFDWICTHSFFGQFRISERPEITQRWHRWLTPGGHVLTSQRINPYRDHAERRFSEPERSKFRARALRLAEQARERGELEVEPAAVAAAADTYTQQRIRWAVGSTHELRVLFESSGFDITRFEEGDARERRNDAAAGPTTPGSLRLRIVAQRPLP
jgi:hypothetical protein